MNHETTAPSLRATAVSILRRLADRLASRAAKRPTIEAIKNDLAYDVEAQLLNAQGDEGKLPDIHADPRITARVYDATKEVGRKSL